MCDLFNQLRGWMSLIKVDLYWCPHIFCGIWF